MDYVSFGFLGWIGKAFTESINVDYHDLNAIIGCKAAYLSKLLRVIHEIVIIDIIVNALEMLFGDLERFISTFLDSNRGHNNNKLSESILLVHFKDTTKIHIGLTCTSFHLDSKVHRAKGLGLL